MLNPARRGWGAGHLLVGQPVAVQSWLLRRVSKWCYNRVTVAAAVNERTLSLYTEAPQLFSEGFQYACSGPGLAVGNSSNPSVVATAVATLKRGNIGSTTYTASQPHYNPIR